MFLLEVFTQLRAIHWVAAAVAILVADFATGPFIQFPILFVIPVAMATATHGRTTGAVVAAVLPLSRLSFFLRWDLPSSWTLQTVDTLTDVAILIGFSLLIDMFLRQQREMRVLKGMLPICGFCKRIRDERGGWHALEAFITERSSAQFSHTFCPDCGREHYRGIVE